jgi:hypothetical protein
MKSWFMVPAVVVTAVLTMGSVALASNLTESGPQGVKSNSGSGLATMPKAIAAASQDRGRLTRSNSGGAISIDVTWLKPEGASTSEALTFEVRMNTHSVDLDRYDMARLSRLESNRGPALEALEWANPGGGGHHRYGLLKFPATLPDGSPIIQPSTRFIEVVINEVGEIAERRFRWDLPQSKTGYMDLSPNGASKYTRYGGG